MLIIVSMNNVLKQVQYKNTLANNLKTFETVWKAAGYTKREERIDPKKIHELMVSEQLMSLFLNIANLLLTELHLEEAEHHQAQFCSKQASWHICQFG